MILGDNILQGVGLGTQLKQPTDPDGGAVFAFQVANPSEYDVIEFDEVGNVVLIEEKPMNPKSDYAILSRFFFDEQAVNVAKNVNPSPRGEFRNYKCDV